MKRFGKWLAAGFWHAVTAFVLFIVVPFFLLAAILDVTGSRRYPNWRDDTGGDDP